MDGRLAGGMFRGDHPRDRHSPPPSHPGEAFGAAQRGFARIVVEIDENVGLRAVSVRCLDPIQPAS